MFLTRKKTMANNKLFHFIIVFFVWATIYLPSLGVPQVAFDEHKRILPAMTMLETGNWAMPELAGTDYFNKPPLINWMIASSFILTGGQSDFSARLPSVISILLFCLLVLFLKSSFLSEQGKLFSALIFLTSFSLIFKGRQAEIDASYTCFTGASIYLWVNFRHDGLKWLTWTIPFIVIGFGLLLKGPMILLFFYVVVISVLSSYKSKKELLSFRHFIGIILMLGIFFSWFAFVYQKSESSGDPTMASIWSHELLLRFKDNINPFKWAGRVLSAIGTFAPWLIFIPFMWKKEWIEAIDEKDRFLFKACRFGAVLGFVLVCLMPGTRGRYSMPAFAFLSIVLGWFLSCQKDRLSIEKIWKLIISYLFSILVIFFNLSALSIIISTLVNIPSKLAEIMNSFKSPLALSTLLFGLIIVNFTISLFFRRRNETAGFEKLIVHSSLMIVCAVLFYSVIILPIIPINPNYRLIGADINQKTEKNAEIWAFKVTSEHFLVYIRHPVKHIYKLHDLPDNARYFLLEKSQYDENGIYPFFTDRKPNYLGLIKADKREFVFLKLNENYVRKQK